MSGAGGLAVRFREPSLSRLFATRALLSVYQALNTQIARARPSAAQASNAPLHVAALLHTRKIIVLTVVHVDGARVCLQMHITTIIQAKRTDGIQASLPCQSFCIGRDLHLGHRAFRRKQDQREPPGRIVDHLAVSNCSVGK